jgi:hypothetical protein
MSTHRCSAGHLASIAFGDEQLRQPCPVCGVDVYKFRDVAPEQDDLVSTIAEEPAPRRIGMPVLDAKQKRLAAGGLALIAAAAFLVFHHQSVTPVPVSSSAVLPLAVQASRPITTDPSAVSITNFSAAPTDSGTVKVSLKLNNKPGVANDYPTLAVHWHDAPGADQLISKDAYSHPPLPFTTADVTLEFARPAGATGIDVKISY